MAGEAKRFFVLTRLKLERENAHADEIAAVNTLEAFGNCGTNAQEQWSLRSPVTRAARAIFFPGDYQQRSSLLLITDRGIIDCRLFASGEIEGIEAFFAVKQAIAQ